MKPQNLGLVQVYTGDGKGKTTTALGLAFRASGHGYSTYIIQFLKGATYLGEVDASKKNPSIHMAQYGQPCPWSDELKNGRIRCGTCRYCFAIHKDDEKRSLKGIEFARKVLTSGKYDIVVLDEINVAMDKKLVPVNLVLDLIKEKSPKTELVLTGRGAPKEILEVADLVTEMKDVRHPMKKNYVGRKGIDY
ncbi:MAG: cob(I)yrinic acid a,c-diamide adenosyltransferase [Candidatus Altiarchaeota archaeon]|nr:cob(I)yrinic acid a,c-diamide adenosyltransferase [Candidatus Altiarchaeota archaeon]